MVILDVSTSFEFQLKEIYSNFIPNLVKFLEFFQKVRICGHLLGGGPEVVDHFARARRIFDSFGFEAAHDANCFHHQTHSTRRLLHGLDLSDITSWQWDGDLRVNKVLTCLYVCLCFCISFRLPVCLCLSLCVSSFRPDISVTLGISIRVFCFKVFLRG